MTTDQHAYNPGFLSDDELVASFCVRTSEFESLMESLRESTGRANQHVIAIGPRGSGKTTLLLRVAAELRSDPVLSSRWLPVVFAEESYEVGTCGEFWLEALSRLADQVPNRPDQPDLRQSVADIHEEQDDQALQDRCLGALLDFADRHDKRLVLVVENLNMIFADMQDGDAGWRLRKTLQTEPRVLLLGSATSRFGEIDRPDKALYDLFKIVQLRPLDYNECAVLWERVSGKRSGFGQIRSLQILTGGNPRLLAVVARFGAEQSFRGLMSNLLHLVDDNTAYFKNHLESLPPQARRVYLALGALWRPSTAREVAGRARMDDTSKCSAQLARLVDSGVVAAVNDTSHRKEYYLTERMYNIYYLLRNNRGKDSLVEALIAFMIDFYSLPDLAAIARKTVESLGAEDTDEATEDRVFLMRLLEQPMLQEHIKAIATASEAIRDHIILTKQATMEGDYVRVLDLYPGLRKIIADHREALGGEYDFLDIVASTYHASALLATSQAKKALAVFDEMARQYGQRHDPALASILCRASIGRAEALRSLGRIDEAVTDYGRSDARSKAFVADPAVGDLLILTAIAKGDLLGHLDRAEERGTAYARAAALATDIIEQRGSAEPSHVLRALESRAYARGMTGDKEGSERDVTEALVLLTKIKPPPGESTGRILTLGVVLGSDRMAELIRNSPAVKTAGVLLAGFELDMGLQPRVAPEVLRVAQDVKKTLDLRRRNPEFARWA